MRKLFNESVLACLAFAAMVTNARLATAELIYDNGPINGNDGGYTIDSYQSISNSFTVSSTTTLSAVQAGLWTDNGAPTSISWAIGTSPGDSDVSSGTATSLTNTFHNIGLEFFSVYETEWAVNGNVGPGTYFLTLTNASPEYVFWDVNYGLSTMYVSHDGINYNPAGYSNSFQVYGNVTAVPEPSSLALAGLGGIGLIVGAIRRRRVTVKLV